MLDFWVGRKIHLSSFICQLLLVLSIRALSVHPPVSVFLSVWLSDGVQFRGGKDDAWNGLFAGLAAGSLAGLKCMPIDP